MPKKFKKKDIPNLRYGILHAAFGYPDGVSIVMKQIEQVMIENMGVKENQIQYFVGRSKNKQKNITQNNLLSDVNKINKLMIKGFNIGYGGEKNEKIENAISDAKKIIHNFIKRKKIDILIAHNTSHPVNFVMSVALSRYYRDAIKNKEKTPKYILWWHDSHLERREYANPANDVEEYLLEGVPGIHVEYTLFINTLQFSNAIKYYSKLEKKKPGYLSVVDQNHDIIYNTSDIFINSYEDLEKDNFKERIEHFLEDYKIRDILKEKNSDLTKTLFVLQNTRILERKRIDFAIKYCYELLKELKRKKIAKTLYFFVSGHSADKTKAKLKRLNRKLAKEYGHEDFIFVCAEDYSGKARIKFEEYPSLFAKLGGISTYFSEIEGFGNNLLEALASGLIPVVYTYPVFINDIAKFKFKIIALEKFEVDKESIKKTIDIIKNSRERKIWVNKNINILKKKLNHRIIASKLKRAIIRRRTHD